MSRQTGPQRPLIFDQAQLPLPGGIVPGSEISPDAHLERPCHNSNCKTWFGGGKGSWKRCSGCLSVGYCSVSCAKEYWPSHKQFCKATAAFRAATKASAPSDKQPLASDLNTYRDVFLQSTTLKSHLAARSALKLFSPESLAWTHYLHFSFEWIPTRPMPDFKDWAAVKKLFRFVRASVQPIKKDEQWASDLISYVKEGPNRFIFAVALEGKNGNPVATGPFVEYCFNKATLIQPIEYMFLATPVMKIIFDPNWEKHFEQRLASPEPEVYGSLDGMNSAGWNIISTVMEEELAYCMTSPGNAAAIRRAFAAGDFAKPPQMPW